MRVHNSQSNTLAIDDEPPLPRRTNRHFPYLAPHGLPVRVHFSSGTPHTSTKVHEGMRISSQRSTHQKRGAHVLKNALPSHESLPHSQHISTATPGANSPRRESPDIATNNNSKQFTAATTMPTQTPPNGAALPQGGPPPSNPPSTPTPTTNVSRVANAAQMATAVPLTIESFLAMVANTPQTQQNAAMAISPAQLAHLSAMWQASQVPATPPMMRPYHPPPPLNVTPARASQNATAVASIDGDIWERENDIIPPPELILGGGRTMDTQLGTGNFDKRRWRG